MGELLKSALSADDPIRCYHKEHVPSLTQSRRSSKHGAKVSTLIVCDVVGENIL